MNTRTPDALQTLPPNINWQGTAALVLDPVALQPLLPRIYQWSDNPQLDCLYLNTPLHEQLSLSPCVVFLTDKDDPVLSGFLSEIGQEPGWLLLSDASPNEVSQYLRSLLLVAPPHGDPALLRLADPATAHVLLGYAEQQGNADWFGPVRDVYCPDALLQRWHHHSVPSKPIVANERAHRPRRLSEAEWTLLEQVSFRQTVIKLGQHMEQHFPDYYPELRHMARTQHWHQLADTAYRQGFYSRQEILMFANVHGFLGPNALEAHPQLQILLQDKNGGTPTQRINEAARVAARLADSKETAPCQPVT